MAESNPFDQFDAPATPAPTTSEAPPAPPAEASPAPATPKPNMATMFPQSGYTLEGLQKAAPAITGAIGSAARGVVKGGLQEPAKFLNENLFDLGGIVIDKDGVRFTSGKDAVKKSDEALATPKDASDFEKALEGVGQFVGAWMLAGKLIKGVQGAQALTTTGRVVRGMEQGALADIIGFDPRQGRLSNLIEQHPELKNPITAYLAAKPDDGDAEGRFKNALEGAMIGGAAEAVFALVRVIKRVGTAKTPAEEAKIIEAAEPEIKAAVQAYDDGMAAFHAMQYAQNPVKMELPVKTVTNIGNELPVSKATATESAGEAQRALREAQGPDPVVPHKEGDLKGPASEYKFREKVSPDEFPERGGAQYKEPVPTGAGDVRPVKEFGRVVGPHEKVVLDLTERVEPRQPLPAAPNSGPPRVVKAENSADALPRVDVEDVPGSAKQSATPPVTAAKTAEEAGASATTRSAKQPAAIKVSEADADSVIKSIAAGDRPIVPETMPGRTLFNFAKMDSPEEAHEVIKAGAAVMAKSLDRYAQKGVYTLERMEQDAGRVLADMIDGDLDLVMGSVRARATSLKDAVAEHLAAKTLMQELARDISSFAGKIERGLDTSERALLIQRVQMLIDTANAVKGVQTQAARLTTAGRIRTGADAIPELLDSLKKGGANDPALRDLAYKLQLAGGDPKAILRTVRTANTPLQIHNTIWRAALLSNYDTHLVNTTANLIHTLALPAELGVGRVLNGLRKGDLGAAWAGAQDAANIYVGMLKTWKDSARVTMKVLLSKEGRPILDSTSKFDENVNAIRFAGMTDERTAFETITKVAAGFVNVPFRLLSTEDEWFKQIAYRGHLYSQLWRQGADQGLKGRGLADFIESNFERAFSPTGKGLNADAMRFAETATFNLPHPAGSWGQTIQLFGQRHPTTALLAPFIRTPANILRRTWDWTPGLNLLRGRFRQDFMGTNGVQRQSEAMGAMAMGIMLYGVAVDMALAGQTTGSLVTGFSDTATSVRRVKQMGGETPYSFVFQHEDGERSYVQFNRLDPFALVFGMAADMVALARAGADDATMEELAGSAILSFANNLASKTYLQGFAQFFQALQDEHRAASFIKQRAGSYVPGFLQQTAAFVGEGDPYSRETRDHWDAIMARVPGVSKDLPPQRNWLTGEPIPVMQGAFLPEGLRAFAMTTTRGKHPAMVELARINYPGRKPVNVIGNVRLTPQQYDDLIQLMANPPGAQSLIDAIGEYMRSPKYQELKDKDPTFFRYQGYEDPRHEDISLLVSKYRQQAEGLLAEKYPELRTELEKDFVNKGRARQGETDLERLLQPKKK